MQSVVSEELQLGQLVVEPVEEVICIDKLAVAVSGVGVVESVTIKASEEVPAAVGVPEITPVELFRLSPDGSEPDEIDQV